VERDGLAAAGFAIDGGNRAGEHPGMLEPQRLLAPGLQPYPVHAGFRISRR
jgi:hypothetical protein